MVLAGISAVLIAPGLMLLAAAAFDLVAAERPGKPTYGELARLLAMTTVCTLIAAITLAGVVLMGAPLAGASSSSAAEIARYAFAFLVGGIVISWVWMPLAFGTSATNLEVTRLKERVEELEAAIDSELTGGTGDELAQRRRRQAS